MNLWLIDPKSNQRSVSLTLLAVSFIAFLIVAGLQVSGKATTSGGITELFGITAGLYFGRKYTDHSGDNMDTASVPTAVAIPTIPSPPMPVPTAPTSNIQSSQVQSLEKGLQ